MKKLACLTLLLFPLFLSAQEMSREERIRLLELLKAEDTKLETVAGLKGSSSLPIEIESLTLQPLSIFLDAVTENATVKSAQSQVEQIQNQYRLEKRNWMNWIRVNGTYSFGRFNVISNNSDIYTPIYQTMTASNQHTFNVGASIGFSLSDIINRPLRLKDYRYQIEQIQYAREQVMEERKLKVMEAYNTVNQQLATIKAKAETAALYNAQMKISENDFIQGKIDIITLSLERSRRSGAVVSYEEARVTLHNSIVILETLTNVKVIKEY
ncbi:MAG: TolC family protein [Prevotellaceae bacterium]|jgi:outer membrane protein TolC|nr:TolC family protein [Prevotellaceae bacterium]